MASGPPTRMKNRGCKPAVLVWEASIAAALSSLTLVLASGCSGASPDTAKDAAASCVILITCDTLRADRLGIYGCERDTSPNLDAFAAESVVFDRAYSAAPMTLPSVCSMLTGRLPANIGVEHNRNFLHGGVETMAEALSAERDRDGRRGLELGTPQPRADAGRLRRSAGLRPLRRRDDDARARAQDARATRARDDRRGDPLARGACRRRGDPLLPVGPLPGPARSVHAAAALRRDDEAPQERGAAAPAG